MAALRADLDQAADMLSCPLATYVVDGTEAIRAEAIVKGAAIDDPLEAVVGN